MSEQTDQSGTTGVDENSRPGDPEKSFKYQLCALFSLTSIFLINFMGRIICGPLMPNIEKDLGILHSDAGSLFLFMTVGFFITLLLSGFVSSRISHRKTIILSATTMGIGLIVVSLSRGLWEIRLTMFFLGLCSGLYIPSGFATLTSLVSSRDYGKAVSIHELAPNASFLLAPLIAEAFLRWFSWRVPVAVLGVASLALGITYARFGRGGRFPGQAPNLRALRTLFGLPSFWIILGLFGLGAACTVGIYSMLPLFLVAEKGMDRSWANTLIGLSRISGLGMAFAAGWVTDRLGPKRTLMIVLSLTGLVTVTLATAPVAWLVPLIFIQSAVAVCFFPPGFSVVASIGPPRFRSLTVSLQIPFAYLFGAGVIPIFIGTLGDAGSFDLSIAMVGGLTLLGGCLSAFLRVDPKEET